MRRVFVSNLSPGLNELSREAQRHLVQVLRLEDGAEVEAFDGDGRLARAVLRLGDGPAALEVAEIREAAAETGGWLVRVASAVPKGERADWMVEKLAELGVAEWLPLEAARSVVVPKGTGKRDRWERIAREAARQSGSAEVMRIGETIGLSEFLAGRLGQVGGGCPGWFGSTRPGSDLLAGIWAGPAGRPGWVVIGPEGGWTDQEESDMRAAGLAGVSLGRTVLRVETSAVVAAALLTHLSAVGRREA